MWHWLFGVQGQQHRWKECPWSNDNINAKVWKKRTDTTKEENSAQPKSIERPLRSVTPGFDYVMLFKLAGSGHTSVVFGIVIATAPNGCILAGASYDRKTVSAIVKPRQQMLAISSPLHHAGTAMCTAVCRFSADHDAKLLDTCCDDAKKYLWDVSAISLAMTSR